MQRLMTCVAAIAISVVGGCDVPRAKVGNDSSEPKIENAASSRSSALEPPERYEDGKVLETARAEPDYSLEYDNCMGGEDSGLKSDFDQTECARAELDRQDAELNRIYRRLMAALGNQRRTELRGLQRAWLIQREATCSDSGEEYQGTLDVMLEAQCYLGKTADRVKWLKEFS